MGRGFKQLRRDSEGTRNILMRLFLLGLSVPLALWMSLSAFAQGGQQPAPQASEPPSALMMEWNFTQPSPEIAALSDECEKRFPGQSHTCEVISRESKNDKHKPFLHPTRSTDVILGSDFGRRGKIVCQMGVPQSALKNPKVFPWLTLVQMQDIFESEKLATQPWTCGMRKCDNGDCRTLGSAALLSNSAASSSSQ